MEAMAQEWTEGRLDELSSKVDQGFERVDRRCEQVDADIRGLRIEMKTEFASVRDETKAEFAAARAGMDGLRGDMKAAATRAEMDGLRADMKAMDDKLTGRLDSVQRTMMQMMVALTAAILAGFAGICTLIAATL